MTEREGSRTRADDAEARATATYTRRRHLARLVADAVRRADAAARLDEAVHRMAPPGRPRP